MFHQTTLKNGLRVITIPMSGTKTTTAFFMIGVGSKYEKREERGISHFLEHLFFKGTKNRPTSLKITSEIDAIGAEFNAFTSKEYTGYYVKSEAGKLALALDVVSDMQLRSLFKAEEIEREKGVIIEEINMFQDNPMLLIEDVYEELLYGDTPAGWDTLGVPDTVRSFTRTDFLRYLNAQYVPHNSTLIIAGAVTPATAKRLATKYFGDTGFAQRGKAFYEKPSVTNKQSAPALKLRYKKTDQTHLMLGVHTVPYGHADRLPLKLLSLILGGSMSARLFISLRERRGLCYYVRTVTESYSDSGYLATRAGVPAAKFDEAVRVILDEYRTLTRTLVPAAELKRAKDMVRGRLAIDNEASDSIANWYARQAYMRDTLERGGSKAMAMESPDDMLKRLDKVSAADLKRVARAYFTPERLNLAAIGPLKNDSQIGKLLIL